MASAAIPIEAAIHARRRRRREEGERETVTEAPFTAARKSDPLFVLTGLLLLGCLLFGGASRENALQTIGLQLLGLPVIGLGLWRIGQSGRWRDLVAPLVILAAMFAVPLLQLLPLAPGLWERLPGRGELADAMRLAGVEMRAMPASLKPVGTMRAALFLLPAAGVFLGAAALARPERRILVSVILAVAALSLVLSVVQVVGGPDSPLRLYPTTNTDGAVGFFANRNHQAALLLAAAPLLAVWMMMVARAPGRLVASLLIGLSLLAVLVVGIAITQSRAGLLLAGPAIVGSLVLIWRNGGRGRKGVSAVAALAAVVAAASVAVFAAGPVMERFSSPVQSEYRAAVWPSVMDGAQHFSPVGSGMGSFSDAYRAFEPLEFVSLSYLNHAHNEYLQLWFEAGWPGLFLLLALAGWVAWRSLRAWLKGAGAGDGLAQAAGVVVALLALHSAVDYPLRTAAMAAVFALMCALLAREHANPESAR